jgi:hypothetical protein
MKKKLLIWLIIVLLALVLALYGCMYIFFGYLSYDPYIFPNSSWQPEKGNFLIDPETILDSLNNGDMNVFSPNLKQADGELPEVVFDGPFYWTPRDYLMIAEALNQKVWKDTLNDWEIYKMVFLMDCQDNPSGFEQGHVIYFKTISNDNGQKSYTIREFFIMPKNGYVKWGGGASAARPLFGWKSIELDKMIDAVDALRIAEENGGIDARLKFNNDCNIHLSLSPEMYAGWDIWYSVGNSSKFKIAIDPFTGKIIK